MSIKSLLIKSSLLISLHIIAACGNISPITKTDGTEAQRSDFTKYHNATVTIGQFVSNVDKDPKAKPVNVTGANNICKTLPKAIAVQMQKQGIKVESESDGILIEGIVIGYKEGSDMLKRLVGFEAGRTHLDIDINILDAKTRDIIGVIQSRQASILTGGVIAVAQTPDFFAAELAKKVAEKMAEMK